MNQSNQSLRTIFNEAVEIPDARQRSEYLAQACGDDTLFRRRIEELIQANHDAGPFLGGAGDTVAISARNFPGASSLPEKPDDRTLRYFGDFQLLEEIAHGGMGVVFKARQTTLNRTVALKMILGGKLASHALVQRFHTEAEAAANLKHPNIVALHEVGDHEGQHYFSMDYIEGQNLAERMRQGPMPLQQAARCIQTIAAAIHYAHQRGVLHRDLKPSNILLDRQEQPHVTDFGLAKLIEQGSSLTQSQDVLGTPSYMAPEQAAGDMKQLTTAADIYSLGAILYELLTGCPPFRAGTALETMRQVMEQEPEQPSIVRSRRRKEAQTSKSKIGNQNPEIDQGGFLASAATEALDRDLETICLKCLRKDPAGRYGSAEALAADLARWQAGEPILARPVSRPERIWRWCRRKPAIAGLVLSVAILIMAVAVGSPVAAVRIARESERARKAEREALEKKQDATDELWHSYLAQARAMRFSGQPGRRFDSLDVLAKAAAIRFAPELRDEAIACLALPDLRLKRRLEAPLDSNVGSLGVFDRALERYAVAATNLGDISIRRVSDEQEVLVLPNPPGTVTTLGQFSHHGKFLSVLCRDHLLRVWDLARRAVILAVPCGPWGDTVDYAPDDRYVAVPAGGAELPIYELASGEKVSSFATPFAAGCARYDPSGRKLAISNVGDKRLVILDSRSGATLRMLTNGVGWGEAAWHPRDSTLAAAGRDGLIYVWDTATGRLLHALTGHQAAPINVAFSHDGDILISSGWDGTRLWRARTGEHLIWYHTPSDLASIAPDDRTYGHTRVDLNSSLELLSFASGREARRWEANEENTNQKLIPSSFMAFSADGHWLAFGIGDSVKLFNARTGDLLATLPTGPVEGACFRKSGDGLLVSGERGVFLWPIRAVGGAGDLSIGPPDAAGPAGAWEHATLSENGQIFAVFHGDHACLFEAETMRKIARTGPCGDQDRFRLLSLSPDGLRLATSRARAGAVKIWDSRTGTLVKELVDPEWTQEHSLNPVFEPNGNSLIIASDANCRVWETNSWTPGLRVSRSDHPAMAISHRSGLMAWRDSHTSIQLRDFASGELLANLESPVRDVIVDLAFSPDDTQLAVTQSGRRELLVWDLRLVREELAKMGLDWNRPPYPPETDGSESKSTRITVLEERPQ